MTPDKRVEEFTTDLMHRARYVQGNQYPEDSEEYKAYQSGFESALAMVYIDLTGTPNSKGMLREYHQDLMSEVVERIEDISEFDATLSIEPSPDFLKGAVAMKKKTLTIIKSK